MILIVEGVVMCFVLLLVCVIGIANGPVGLVVFYEQEVKNRVIELGLTTIDRIKKTSIITVIALFVPMLVLVPYMVYGINGARSFRDGFWQMLVIFMISGLFDRILHRLVVGWPYKDLDYSGHRGLDAIHIRKDAGQEMAGNIGWLPDPCSHSGWSNATYQHVTRTTNSRSCI